MTVPFLILLESYQLIKPLMAYGVSMKLDLESCYQLVEKNLRLQDNINCLDPTIVDIMSLVAYIL